jgi:predicted nucleotidyltransferase
MSTRPGIPPEVNDLTDRLVTAMRKVLGTRLTAVYLFGSATTGAFEPGISDVDTLAVLTSDPTDADVSALAAMHEDLVQEAPTWRDRIEVNYVSATALAGFRRHPWPAVRISPGEPLHRIDIDRRWVLDWYALRATGVALFGPPPDEVVPRISRGEFVQAVREQVQEWPGRISGDSSPGGLAYAVLTLCRALCACSTGAYLSKKEAARWASHHLPEFRDVIEGAVAWRYGGPTPIRRPLDQDRTLRFSEAVARRCTGPR